MYNYSGKGLFSNKPSLRDLKQKMDEAKNRTPEQKAEIKKASDEKRQQMKQQKKERLDENLQLASLLARKAGRTISKGSTMVDNLYKKVGIDVGMDKKREDAGKIMSNLGKIGTRILQGKGAFDKLRNDPKYQKLLEDVKRSGYHEITTPEESQRRRERELYEKYSKQPPIGLMGKKGGFFGIKKIKIKTPEEEKQSELKRAEKMKKRKEMATTGINLLTKGTKMALDYADNKINKAIDKYGLEKIGINKVHNTLGSGFADALKKVQKQQSMTPAEKEEQARKQAEKKKKLAENVMTGIKLFDQGQLALNKFGQNKFNKAVDSYGLERIGIKKDTKNLPSIFDKKGSGEDYGGFLPKEKQFFKVAKEDYSTLKTYLLFLSVMPEKIMGIKGTDIVSSDIPVDMKIADMLRDIK
jgi:hypothetical protein